MAKPTLDEIFNNSKPTAPVQPPTTGAKPSLAEIFGSSPKTNTSATTLPSATKPTLAEIFGGNEAPIQQPSTTLPPGKKEGLFQKTKDVAKEIGSAPGNFAIGALKGVGNTILGTAQLGSRMGGAAIGGINKLLGVDNAFSRGAEQGANKVIQTEGSAKSVMAPEGLGEKIGFGTEQIAEFLIPGTTSTKVGTAAGLLTKGKTASKLLGLGAKALTEGVLVGGQTAMQKGEVGEEAKTAAIIGTLFPIVGAGLSGVKKAFGGSMGKLGEKIQYSVIKPGASEMKDGFNIANVKKYNLGGSLAETATKTQNELNKLTTKLQTALKSSDKAINLNNIIKETEQSLNIGKASQFGDNKAIKRVLESLKSEVHEVSGKNGLVDLVEATNIKRGAGTKGSWVFGSADPDASAVEKVYTNFYQKLKTAIEKSSPEDIKGINQSISELIPISNAVLRRLPIEARNNVLSLTDNIGLFSAIFDPRALALLGVKKLSTSGKFGEFLVKAAEKWKNKVPATQIGERIFGR